MAHIMSKAPASKAVKAIKPPSKPTAMPDFVAAGYTLSGDGL